MNGNRTVMQHWPVIGLALLVCVIFLGALVAFEVKETEHAVVLRFGKPRIESGDTVKVYSPGLHLKWPYPIETVWYHDNRLQCYELRRGQVEQVQTADDYQVIVTTFVLWRVGDPGLFLKRVGTAEEAEKKLDDVVRNSRNIAIGRHSLTELINVDPTQVRIPEIEKGILAHAQEVARSRYGIDLEHLGFKHLGFPETVSTKVFARMRAERNRKSEKYRAEGKRDAQRIRAEADLAASELLSAAEAEAKRTRAEGDRDAAEYYAVFRSNPDLAAFLRKLDSLRESLSEKTTLILDTRTPPFDLFQPEAFDLEKGLTLPKQAGGTGNGRDRK
jgi:membrane protease subunit HflC